MNKFINILFLFSFVFMICCCAYSVWNLFTSYKNNSENARPVKLHVMESMGEEVIEVVIPASIEKPKLNPKKKYTIIFNEYGDK